MNPTPEMIEAGLGITLSSVDLPASECLHGSDVQEILTAALALIPAEPLYAAPPAAVQEPVAVKALEWVGTLARNANNYHGSEPVIVAYKTAGDFLYTLTMNYGTGGSWDAMRGRNTPIAGGTCVSLEAAKAAAQADYEQRIRSALSTSQSDPAPEIAALRAENERLRKALQPFADAAAAYDGMPPPKYFGDTDFELIYSGSTKATVTVGQLRDAHAAVAPQQEEAK